jgi:hypothetical protein
MSLKQIKFRVHQSQIDLEDDLESPRLQHRSCSSHQEISIAASLILFCSTSREQFLLEVSDLVRYIPDLPSRYPVFKLIYRVDRSSNSLQLLYGKFFYTINFFC